MKSLLEKDFGSSIRSGFEATGLYPLNPDRVLRKLPTDRAQAETAVETQLLRKLSEIRYNPPATKVAPRPRQKDKLPPGASYTSCTPGGDKQQDQEDQDDPPPAPAQRTKKQTKKQAKKPAFVYESDSSEYEEVEENCSIGEYLGRKKKSKDKSEEEEDTSEEDTSEEDTSEEDTSEEDKSEEDKSEEDKSDEDKPDEDKSDKEEEEDKLEQEAMDQEEEGNSRAVQKQRETEQELDKGEMEQEELEELEEDKRRREVGQIIGRLQKRNKKQGKNNLEQEETNGGKKRSKVQEKQKYPVGSYVVAVYQSEWYVGQVMSKEGNPKAEMGEEYLLLSFMDRQKQKNTLKWPERQDILNTLKCDVLFACQPPEPSACSSSSRSTTFSLSKADLSKAEKLFKKSQAYYPTRFILRACENVWLFLFKSFASVCTVGRYGRYLGRYNVGTYAAFKINFFSIG
jgi:hypothetical protein